MATTSQVVFDGTDPDLLTRFWTPAPVRAGATRLRVLEPEGLDHFAVVLQHPEGNGFCLR
ncbi:MAG TPA: hypothetical protein VJ644_00210 [Jiangellaceae bacterium]|nr:hypothetical protein [Jiangellaceae bacterium]